jgi:phage host-nuclease inhibitor protein Gam
MNDEKLTTEEIELQRSKAGLVLQQAATVCDANRDALLAVCKLKTLAFGGDDQNGGVMVESIVQMLYKFGHHLRPRNPPRAEAGIEKLRKEEVRTMMSRSGRAVRNAAYICKANGDMLVSFLKTQTDVMTDAGTLPAFVDAVAAALLAYALQLEFDESIEGFKTAGNPFRF